MAAPRLRPGREGPEGGGGAGRRGGGGEGRFPRLCAAGAAVLGCARAGRGPRAEGARWAVGASAGNPRNRPPQDVLVHSSGRFRTRQVRHVEVRAASVFLPSAALSRGFGGRPLIPRAEEGTLCPVTGGSRHPWEALVAPQPYGPLLPVWRLLRFNALYYLNCSLRLL